MPALLSSIEVREADGERVRTAILFPLVTSLLYAGGADALSLYNKTEYTAAIAVLNQSNPDSMNLELLGQCFFMLGDFKKSTEALERSAVLDPGDSMIQTWLGRAWGRRAETSFALNALGYATKAREAFEKALQMDPGNKEALGDLFDFYMDAPGMIGGGMEKAAGLLPQFGKYDPVGGYLAQARLDEKKKQFESAEAGFRRALAASPRTAGLVVDVAQFLARRGRYEESDEAFRQAESLAPGSPRILFARADSYIKSRRKLDEARDLLKKYLASKDLTPNDPPRWEALRLLKKAEGG
jgi:tetratricopeptide (TPR) repeat protein